MLAFSFRMYEVNLHFQFRILLFIATFKLNVHY